ncbi:hypothetical protein [Fictibacillus barbaricus]|uniref:hypothetical protein n=1 Tax=Fictibacillus barbaricus TaxID=182136 RepID=UPI0016688D5A|nr:hypothetical protein [Fictibacillus barbaricus]GGB53466.1 hypothetical protein GCM10007199_18910 [Fictibacillus barbaricus]
MFVVKGVRHYVTHKDETYIENHPIFKHAKSICVVGENLIVNWHQRAGNNDLSKPWITRSLREMLISCESVAEMAYRNFKKDAMTDLLVIVKSGRVTGKRRYLGTFKMFVRKTICTKRDNCQIFMFFS